MVDRQILDIPRDQELIIQYSCYYRICFQVLSDHRIGIATDQYKRRFDLAQNIVRKISQRFGANVNGTTTFMVSKKIEIELWRARTGFLL